MYVEGTAAKLAQELANDPVARQKMTGKICYDAVLHCLRTVSGGKFFTKDGFASQQEALTVLFASSPKPVQEPRIRADSVVGVLRKTFANKPFELSHVMISIDGVGGCIGSNNGAIGGPGNWSKVDISKLLTWRPQQNPIYEDRLQPAAPAWAKERVVIAKPVRELLTMV